VCFVEGKSRGRAIQAAECGTRGPNLFGQSRTILLVPLLRLEIQFRTHRPRLLILFAFDLFLFAFFRHAQLIFPQLNFQLQPFGMVRTELG